MSEGIGITDLKTKEQLLGSEDQRRDILIFERKKKNSIIPTPGQTTIDGRKLPTALEVLLPTTLIVIPIERAQSPLFVERPLEHNFLCFIGMILNIGVITLRSFGSGIISSTGRRYMEVELRQDIKNAIVNGKESQDVAVTIRLVGIEGELVDHLLITKYLVMPGDREVDADRQTLQKLVTSFRPLKIINAEEKRKEIATQADKKFKELLAENGEEIFNFEFSVQLLRLKGANLEDPEVWFHSMKSLKPFEVFAREINLHDEKLDSFWVALHQAEGGDATNFKTNLIELIEADSEQAAIPPEAEKDNEKPDLISD